MYAVLSSLITAVGANDEETLKTLQELKEAIDGIKEEDPDDSKVEEISNRIKDLSSKFENSNKKKEFEKDLKERHENGEISDAEYLTYMSTES